MSIRANSYLTLKNVLSLARNKLIVNAKFHILLAAGLEISTYYPTNAKAV